MVLQHSTEQPGAPTLQFPSNWVVEPQKLGVRQKSSQQKFSLIISQQIVCIGQKREGRATLGRLFGIWWDVEVYLLRFASFLQFVVFVIRHDKKDGQLGENNPCSTKRKCPSSLCWKQGNDQLLLLLLLLWLLCDEEVWPRSGYLLLCSFQLLAAIWVPQMISYWRWRCRCRCCCHVFARPAATWLQNFCQNNVSLIEWRNVSKSK